MDPKSPFYKERKTMYDNNTVIVESNRNRVGN